MSASFRVALLSLVTLFFLVACKKEKCKDKVCPDCVTPILSLKYTDTTGACLMGFKEATSILGFKNNDYTDTIYMYGANDSCNAKVLIKTGFSYVISNGALNIQDTVTINSVSYNSGYATDKDECCFCQGVNSMNVLWNDTTFTIGGVTYNRIVE
jgi:hypothetical protein